MAMIVPFRAAMRLEDGGHRVQTTSDSLESIDQALGSVLEDAVRIVESLGKANSANATIEPWQKQVVSSLVSEVAANCVRMRFLLGQLDATVHAEAATKLTFPMLAHVVRNLLELGVWIQFCCKSKRNAERFHGDRFRDGLGFSKAATQLLDAARKNARAADPLRAITTLKEAATKAGIPLVDDRYTQVADAAKELGLREFYAPVNKMLSKFAHPTAMALLAPLEGEPLAETFSGLFAVGLILATLSLRVARERVKSLGATLG
jgi:hypothetical protein